MGCISSKFIMTRSNSLKEEMNQSFQRMAKGFTVLEDLCSPRNGGDPVLSLVCSSHNVGGKLHIRNLTLYSDTDMRPSVEAMSPEIINTWDLMAGLEEEEEDDDEDDDEEGKQQQSPPRVETAASVGTRSKSFHWSPECALRTKPNSNGTEVIIRSRSFHTVQEFDEMLERNWMPKAVLEAHKSQDLVPNIKVRHLDAYGSNLKEYEDANDNSVAVYEKEESQLGGQEINSVKELNVIEGKEIMQVDKPKHQQNNKAATEMLVNSTSSNYTIKMIDIVEDTTVVNGNAMTERRGLRRKVIADGLTTLKIPTENIDFPAASTSLKEWLDVGGQLFSPGAYVTPKFGPLPSNSVNENRCNSDFVFDHEIVTAFEEAMQQLQADEECILRQIIKDFEKGSSKEKEVDI